MRYLALIIAAFATAEIHAGDLAPRLVVTVTVDQLRSDYIEAFGNYYSNYGFRRIIENGLVYDAASYPFVPVDRSSAIAALSTGALPFFNGIVGNEWLDRKTLQSTSCVSDINYRYSPAKLRTSTIGDELKVSSKGRSLVYSVAPTKEEAILSAGHAADGGFWIDDNGQWTGTYYYGIPQWVRNYNNGQGRKPRQLGSYMLNEKVVDMINYLMRSTAIGLDDVTDLLNVSLSASLPEGQDMDDWQSDMAPVYQNVDYSIGRIIDAVGRSIDLSKVLFVVTSTGYADEKPEDLEHYRIPTGTFYIDRTASLLNMYLGAIYGQGRYVEQCFDNELFFNHRLIEEKHLSMSEILGRSQEFLLQLSGVADICTSDRLLSGNNDIQKLRAGYNPALSGDIIINVAPGWRLLNETTGQTFVSRNSVVPFPVIFFGAGIKHERISSPVTVDRIAPTIAKTIRIRAPNGCDAQPLF